MEDKAMKLLSFIIGIFFFMFYIFIMDIVITSHKGSFLEFPYILLSIYFFISIFTFPLVSIEASEKTHNKNFLIRNYALIGTYLMSPIWVGSKLLKNRED